MLEPEKVQYPNVVMLMHHVLVPFDFEYALFEKLEYEVIVEGLSNQLLFQTDCYIKSITCDELEDMIAEDQQVVVYIGNYYNLGTM